MLALSDEDDKKVAEYMEQHDIQVRVASGYKQNPGYPSRGIPASFVIGPKGKILWKGHPSSISSGLIKKALKGAKKGSTNYMSFNSATDFDNKAVAKLAEAAGSGKMGKALKGARALIAKADGAQEQAKAFEAELVAYGQLLGEQTEVFITKHEMVKGTDVLAAIAKEFKGQDIGDAAATRLKEIEGDEALAMEWKADKALIKARAFAAKKGMKKAVKKFEDVGKKFANTTAGKKARALTRKARLSKH